MKRSASRMLSKSILNSLAIRSSFWYEKKFVDLWELKINKNFQIRLRKNVKKKYLTTKPRTKRKRTKKKMKKPK